MHSQRLKADLLLVLLAFIWGTAFLAQNVAGGYGIAFTYNGACFTIAGLLLLPFSKFPLARAQWKWMGIAGLLLFGGAALQQLGLYYTKVANASFLTSLYVVFTPFLLWIFFREKPRHVHAVAVLLAATGAYLLSTGGHLELHWGDVMELGGAVFWAVHILVAAKYVAQFPAISFAAGQFLVCGLLSFAFGLGREPLAPLLETPVLEAAAYRAVLSIAVGYTMQLWAQKFTPPTDAALIFALESVFAAVAAAVLIHERLTGPQLAGCALILAAAGLSQVRDV